MKKVSITAIVFVLLLVAGCYTPGNWDTLGWSPDDTVTPVTNIIVEPIYGPVPPPNPPFPPVPTNSVAP